MLVSAISILTIPNTLTVLLEYIYLFQFQNEANIREELHIKVSSIMLEISPNMLGFCFMLSIPYYA